MEDNLEKNNETKEKKITFFPKTFDGWLSLIIVVLMLITAYFYYKDITSLNQALQYCQSRCGV